MENIVILIFFMRIYVASGNSTDKFRYEYNRNKTDMVTAFKTCKASEGSLLVYEKNNYIPCKEADLYTADEPAGIWIANYKRYSPWIYYRGCYSVVANLPYKNVDSLSTCVLYCISNGHNNTVVAYSKAFPNPNRCACQIQKYSCGNNLPHGHCSKSAVNGNPNYFIFEVVSLKENSTSSNCLVQNTTIHSGNKSICDQSIQYTYDDLKEFNVTSCYSGNGNENVAGYFKLPLEDKATQGISNPISCSVLRACQIGSSSRNITVVPCNGTEYGYVCRIENIPTTTNEPTTSTKMSSTTSITTDTIKTTPFPTDNFTLKPFAPTTPLTQTDEITTNITDMTSSKHIVHTTSGTKEIDTISVTFLTTDKPHESSSQYITTNSQTSDTSITEIANTEPLASVVTDKLTTEATTMTESNTETTTLPTNQSTKEETTLTTKTEGRSRHSTTADVMPSTNNDSISTATKINSQSPLSTSFLETVPTTIRTSGLISEAMSTTTTLGTPTSSKSDTLPSTSGAGTSKSISETFHTTTLAVGTTAEIDYSSNMQTKPAKSSIDTTEHETTRPQSTTATDRTTAEKSSGSNVILPVGGALGGLLVLVIVTIIVIKIRNRKIYRGNDHSDNGWKKGRTLALAFDDYHDFTIVNDNGETKFPTLTMSEDDQSLKTFHDENNYALVQKKHFGQPQNKNGVHFSNDEQPSNTRAKSCIIPRPQVDSDYDHVQRRSSGDLQRSENLYGSAGDDCLYDTSVHSNNGKRESDIYM